MCSNCGVCWEICPYKAIEQRKEKIGEIFLEKIKENFWLVVGKAKVGVEETGPIVLETKKFALEFAKKEKIDFVIFDTPPGIHCPTISSLLDCDMVYCVTEPTPLGAHDLKLILEVCKKLKLKTKIIINFANLGNKKLIEEISKIYKIKIEKEIEYSPEIFKAYLKGNLCQFLNSNVKSVNINLKN